MNNNQRKDSISNTHVGNDFEVTAKKVLEGELKIPLIKGFKIEIGLNGKKKHAFDLGSDINTKVIVECKSYKWTETGNNPSAKIAALNLAMYYFHLAPGDYRKILFLLKDVNNKNETLGSYYCKNHWNLIPKDVEIFEYDEKTKELSREIRGEARRTEKL